MTKQMTKERFFILKEFKTDDDYSQFNLIDSKTGEYLEAVCFDNVKPSSFNGKRFLKCSGSVGFLHSNSHKGYAQLFYTKRKKSEDTLSIDFSPTYTKDGELIFIKTYKECPYCIASRDKKENNNKEQVILSFIKYW